MSVTILVQRWLLLSVFIFDRFRSIRIWRRARAASAARNRARTSVATSPVSATTVARAGSWTIARTRPPATTSHWCATTARPAAPGSPELRRPLSACRLWWLAAHSGLPATGQFWWLIWKWDAFFRFRFFFLAAFLFHVCVFFRHFIYGTEFCWIFLCYTRLFQCCYR